ncbi:MAG: AMP-binding protein, partial [Planctomycetota bacterium]
MSDNTRPRGLGGLWDRLRTRFFYRVSVTGTTRLPSLGGGLIVSNHVSPVDPELIWRALHSTGGRELADRLEFLPVEREADGEPNTDPDLIARAREKLKAGGLVCLFAEGRVPRSGKLLRFTHAMEELVRDLNVPIIPLAIDRPWGSLVQIRGGKARWKWPRRFPYPVNMRFGESLAPSSSAFRVRLAVQEQQASLLASRIYPSETLPNKFIRAARRFPFRLAMVDHSGKELSFLKALAGTIALRARLKTRLEEDQRVGVLLPPTVGGALVNAALGMLGKVAVNLNYTASPEIYRYCVEKAKLKRVLTSKKFLEKIGWEASEEMLFLEDVLPEVTIFRRIGALLAASLLPTRALCRLYSKPTDPNAPVAVLFSSGSTGNPKGVVLSHFNILSNVQGMAQLLDFQPTDRIMGVLPFFHAFGYAVTLWFPLAAGYGAIYFPNPRDGRQVAKLIHKHRGTVIVCPPTFFQMYLRQCDPEQLRSLRYAIAGAEKLKAVLARQFEERFGLPLLEGYGATELSPAVSLNTFDSRDGDDVEVGRKSGSIGHPLPGVAVKAVHLDTGEDLDAGEEGMLLVKGPNVML